MAVSHTTKVIKKGKKESKRGMDTEEGSRKSETLNE